MEKIEDQIYCNLNLHNSVLQDCQRRRLYNMALTISRAVNTYIRHNYKLTLLNMLEK